MIKREVRKSLIQKNIEVLERDKNRIDLEEKEWKLVHLTTILQKDIEMKVVRFKTKKDPKVYGMYILDIKNERQLLELYSLDIKEIATNFINFQEIYFGKIIQKNLVQYDGLTKIIYEKKKKITGTRLGQLFIELGYIKESTLNNALKIQRLTGEQIGNVLQQMTTKISDKDLYFLLKMQKIKRKQI
jgi:hypothetical protein